MQVATLIRDNESTSLNIYISNITRELAIAGVEIVPFTEEGTIPEGSDLVWDPAMCMRPIPRILRACKVPVIGTMHGVKSFSLPIEELTADSAGQNSLQQLKRQVEADWKWFRNAFAAMIAVSNYCKTELVSAFNLNSEQVHVVNHGIDHDIFSPDSELVDYHASYFLHVSRLDPVKNIDRILDAYTSLPIINRPELVIVGIPECDQEAYRVKFSRRASNLKVRWIRSAVSQIELARWYRGAIALVQPSLRETFGFPIIEAMACGCPVITSNSTACSETAGEAALLVDSRSSNEIAAAMKLLLDNRELRHHLRGAGIKRAMQFTWKKSSERHLQIFQAVYSKESKRTPCIRKIEVTTVAPCHVACKFCPQQTFESNYQMLGGKKVMDWKTYTTSIDNLPSRHVCVSFGGFSEPFQNPLCPDMILYAKKRGHKVEIFTTLVGLNLDQLKIVLKSLLLGLKPVNDRLFVHVPSEEPIESIIINNNYISKLSHLLSINAEADYHYHGSRINSRLAVLSFGDKLRHWPLHNRAINETIYYKKRMRCNGSIECVMNLEVNCVLPNGDVLICCQDFGIQHVIGNVLRDSYETMYENAEFKNVQMGLKKDDHDIMCRYCDFAVKVL